MIKDSDFMEKILQMKILNFESDVID